MVWGRTSRLSIVYSLKFNIIRILFALSLTKVIIIDASIQRRSIIQTIDYRREFDIVEYEINALLLLYVYLVCPNMRYTDTSSTKNIINTYRAQNSLGRIICGQRRGGTHSNIKLSMQLSKFTKSTVQKLTILSPEFSKIIFINA